MGSIETSDLLQRGCSIVVPTIVVAIPVHNERDHIGSCLDALASQSGLVPGSFGILLFLNNCSDGTADLIAGRQERFPWPVRVLDVSRSASTAGWARRCAMEAAASWLREADAGEAILLTTDADSRVPPDWVARNLAHIAEGADAVAGRIALEPEDAALLPERLKQRGVLEARYEALLTEICARLDPEPGNLWPTHWAKSGATIAVRLAAYEQVGGMPSIQCGEDRAFIDALRSAGCRVRHAVDIEVITSGRLVGRATGGVADTIRLRCEQPDAFCDDRLEPAMRVMARVLLRRYLRFLHANGWVRQAWLWALFAGLTVRNAGALATAKHSDSLMAGVEAGPRWAFTPVRPARLPGQIRIAVVACAIIRAFSRPAVRPIDSRASVPGE